MPFGSYGLRGRLEERLVFLVPLCSQVRHAIEPRPTATSRAGVRELQHVCQGHSGVTLDCRFQGVVAPYLPDTKFRKVYQEVDDVPAFEPVTKLNATIDAVERIPDMLRQAFRVAYKLSYLESYGGSVAKLPEVFDAVESGLLDIGLVSTPFEPANLFLQNYGFKVPFGTPDPVVAGEIAREIYDSIPAMTSTLEKNGQLAMAVLTTSNYSLITVMPWESMSDLKGHKIMAAGPNLPWLTGTGAVPVQGSLDNVYNGLQMGVFDGMIIHYQGMSGFKIYEVAPYVAKLDFGSMPINMMSMNKRSYDRLPRIVQRILTEVALEYEQMVNVENRRRDADVISAMIAKGATLLDIAPEVQVEWAKHLADIPRQGVQEGQERNLPMKDVLEKYLAALKLRGIPTASLYSLQ